MIQLKWIMSFLIEFIESMLKPKEKLGHFDFFQSAHRSQKKLLKFLQTLF